MTNEDAVKWLENLRQDIGQLRHEDLWHYEQAIVEIMEMLKEQEAVEPEEIINDFYPVGDYRRTLGWRCGKCGETLMGDRNYCSCCGQAVKWE